MVETCFDFNETNVTYSLSCVRWNKCNDYITERLFLPTICSELSKLHTEIVRIVQRHMPSIVANF
jgi:hypothetical protein